MSRHNRYLVKMMTDREYLVRDAHGVLAKLWRLTLAKRKIKLENLNKLLLDWLDNPDNNIANDNKTRSFRRGNMVKAITSTEMTWKMFIRCMKLIKADYVEINTKVGYPDQIVSERVVVPIMDISIDDLESVDDDD